MARGRRSDKGCRRTVADAPVLAVAEQQDAGQRGVRHLPAQADHEEQAAPRPGGVRDGEGQQHATDSFL